MTQLSYNEAFDPYHTTFRYIRLYFGCHLKEAISFDKFRILDFYLLYPFRLQNMKFFAEDTAWRAVSKSYARLKPYGELPDDNSLFERMSPFQKAAASSLAHAGIISSDAWLMNEIQFVQPAFPESIEFRCVELNNSMADFIEILCKINEKYKLNGSDGLKFRSGLLEYRYDPI